MKFKLVSIALLVLSALNLYAEPIAPYESFAGNINFVTAGNTLRTSATDTCAVTTGPVSASVVGVPGGSTIQKAYLYWAGSGSTADNTVTFAGSTINAERSFTDTFSFGGTDYDFWQNYADVTTQVTGNGSYAISNMAVNNGAPHCAVSAVYAGFALLVVYTNPTEDFRVLNVFDGLQWFRGSSVDLTPNNFVVPVSPVNGKLAILSWEGDTANSGALGGFTEDVLVNGGPLTDAANPPGNQYNSTINTYGTGNNFYSMDWDEYDISALLSPGDTGATSTYSSGADLVLLGVQAFLNTNTPVSDLSIAKTHTGDFNLNEENDFTLTVTNNGPISTAGTTTVTDDLPAGLDFVSGAGTGWSCSFAAPTVTCTSTQVVADGNTFNPITLKVIPRNSLYPQFQNTAEVSGSNFDNIDTNNDSIDTVDLIAPDLSTSTKTFADLDGGEIDVGDILQFTVSLINTSTSGAAAVQLTDDIPAELGSLSVVSIPAGATDNSTGSGTGANGTGFLDIQNISVPANSTVDVVFNLAVSGSLSPGDTFSNTANITDPIGPNASPSTFTATVSPSLVPNVGVKELYVEHDQGQVLNRIVNTTSVNININGGANNLYTLSPALQTDLELGTGNITIPVRLRETGAGTVRTIEMTLDYTGPVSAGVIGTDTIVYDSASGGAWQNLTFSMNVASPIVIPVGSQIRLRVSNLNTVAGERIRYREVLSGVNFKVNLNANTVIKVENTETYSAAYSGGALKTNFTPGSTVYIRSDVSDPFGSYDITAANITIRDPFGNVVVSNQPMTEVNDSGLAIKTYEYPHITAGTAIEGQWTYTITAEEGTEGTITHSKNGVFNITDAIVDIKATKSNALISDPVRGTASPLRVPGAVIEYTINSRNEGEASPDNNSVVVADPLPPRMIMCVTNLCSGAASPVQVVNGTPSSGLLFNYATDVKYSNQVGGGAPYNYTPVPDTDGYDELVKGLQVTPSGVFNSSSGSAPYPNFDVIFRTKIK